MIFSTLSLIAIGTYLVLGLMITWEAVEQAGGKEKAEPETFLVVFIWLPLILAGILKKGWTHYSEDAIDDLEA